MFSGAEYYLLLVSAVALVLLVSNWLRPDLVALLVLLALALGRLVTPEEALAGFSRPVVMTLLGLFVITETLEQTGVVQWLANYLARLSGHSEGRVVTVFLLAGAVLSLIMNNVAAGAVLLPAAVQVARQADIRPSKVLMPLAFGTLLGGMATFFTTANIIMSSTLQGQGQRALTMLDFLPSGGAMVITGTVYMLLIGRRLLPSRDSLARENTPLPINLRAAYQLDERLWEVRIPPGSQMVGQTFGSRRIRTRLGITVLAIWHGREAKIDPTAQDVIEANDLLLVVGREERVLQLAAEGATIGRAHSEMAVMADRAVQLNEAIIGPRAPVIDQTLRGMQFRSKYGLTAVALWRGGRSYRTDIGTMPLQAGDALLLIGAPQRIAVLAREPGIIVLDQPVIAAPNTSKGWLAALISVIAIGLSASGLVATPEAMLGAFAALVITGCIRMEDAYRAIEWRIIFLIAGLLPIGIALANTGLATQVGQAFSVTLVPFGPLALVAGLYIFTLLLTQVIGGQVSALVVGPVAVSAAIQAGVNPPAVAVAVAMACSASFLTPIAHPVNLLMMNPGGYTGRDFLRVGLGMTVVCVLTLLVVMPLFWRL